MYYTYEMCVRPRLFPGSIEKPVSLMLHRYMEVVNFPEILCPHMSYDGFGQFTDMAHDSIILLLLLRSTQL